MLFTADNIRPSAEREISPANLLLYFPCKCLPAVVLKFSYRRLLNPLLETLPPLRGVTTTEGLYVSCHISGLTSWYWLYTTVSIAGCIHQLLSIHINTLKIGKISPIVAIHIWPASCQQTFKPAVVGSACRADRALQTLAYHCWFVRWGIISKTINYMQYSIIWRDNVSNFNLWNSPSLFTAENIHTRL